MSKNNMNNQETADHIREYVKTPPKGLFSHFSWATDACGYAQHIKFVKYRNQNWHGGEWDQFCLDYADSLENAK